MRKAIYLLIAISLLILPIIGQQGQKGHEEQKPEENSSIYNQNDNQNNNQNNNPNNNQNENPNNNNHNVNPNNNQNNRSSNQGFSFNCNENKNHPNCLKEEPNQIFEELKSNIPLFMNKMKNNSDSFSQLNPQEQIEHLMEEKNNFENLRENFERNQNQENRKQVMEKATEIAGFLTQKDCSNVSESTSDILKDENFKECRNGKKEILTNVIELIKDYVQCNNINELISQGVSNNKQENFKYILFLIYEISSNPDSLKEGQSEVLYNVTLCLEEYFNTFWGNVESEISDSKDKIDAKKDISLILFKTLSNLVNIHHYDEIDGYLDEIKNISNFGIMRNEQAKKLHKGILDFAQQFHDFGNGTYNISSSMNISIIKFDDLNNNNLFDQEQIYNLSEKGIYVSFKPRKMMNDTGGNTVQFISYDSPLVPLNNSNNKNNIVRDFISLSIFDEDGNELNITDLQEDARPIIFYNQKQNRNMKQCFFFNESNEDLDRNGITSENVTINGEKYLKCSSEHLTSFTASYDTSSSATSETQSNSNLNYISFMKWYCIFFILWF